MAEIVQTPSTEVARTDEDAHALVEARRAMYRGRQIDGTFDEVGQGPMRPDDSLSGLMASKPTEDELREYKRRREQERRDEYAR